MKRFVRLVVTLGLVWGLHACFAPDVCNAGEAEDVDQALHVFISGDNSAALGLYQDLVRNYPESQQVGFWQYRVSWCYWQMKNYSSALAARETALQMTSDAQTKREWQNETVGWYISAGQYAGAISLLDKLARENPNDPSLADWYVSRSVCDQLSGNDEASIKDLEKAVELASTPELKQKFRAQLAGAYVLKGDYDKARLEYVGLIKDYTGAPDVPYWYCEISLCSWKQKRYDDCFRVLQKAIATVRDADTKKSWQKGCAARAYQLKEYGTVVSVIAEPATKCSDVDLNRLLARSYVHLKTWEEAVAAYQRLKRRFPEHTSEWQLWIGYCYEQQDDYQQAESIFREFIAKYPKDDLIDCANFRLARCLTKEGKDKEAQALLSSCKKPKPEPPEKAQPRVAGATGNTSTIDTKSGADLDLFPDVDENAVSQLLSRDNLVSFE